MKRRTVLAAGAGVVVGLLPWTGAAQTDPGSPREELIVYGPRVDEVVREAAGHVDKIFKGANPAELPIGRAKTFELVVNRKTAKALGVTLSQELILRADEVIE
jgi:hypothetical protein